MISWGIPAGLIDREVNYNMAVCLLQYNKPLYVFTDFSYAN